MSPGGVFRWEEYYIHRDGRVAQSQREGGEHDRDRRLELPIGPWPGRHAILSECGERPLLPRELTLRGLVGQVFEALTSIDGRLLNSFRSLVSRPAS